MSDRVPGFFGRGLNALESRVRSQFQDLRVGRSKRYFRVQLDIDSWYERPSPHMP